MMLRQELERKSEIDHIVPCFSYSAKNEEFRQILVCTVTSMNHRSVHRSIALSLVFLLSAAMPMLAREAGEQKRIDHLLHVVGALGDAKFIRNGTEYDAKAAEAHLQQKLDYAGEKLQTAEQFIEYCATQSSMSGQAYKIRLPDGKTVEAGTFLRAKLAEFDRTKP